MFSVDLPASSYSISMAITAMRSEQKLDYNISNEQSREPLIEDQSTPPDDREVFWHVQYISNRLLCRGLPLILHAKVPTPHRLAWGTPLLIFHILKDSSFLSFCDGAALETTNTISKNYI